MTLSALLERPLTTLFDPPTNPTVLERVRERYAKAVRDVRRRRLSHVDREAQEGNAKPVQRVTLCPVCRGPRGAEFVDCGC